MILLLMLLTVVGTKTLMAKETVRLKPFVLADTIKEQNFTDVVASTKDKLALKGFELLGEYAPYKDSFVKNAHVLVVTNPELLAIAKNSFNGGFAAPWRVAITETQSNIQISYPNPMYISHAYHLKGNMQSIKDALKEALGDKEHFGSKKGLTPRKLARYKYTLGMEKFHKVYFLAEHQTHTKALEVLEANLANNNHGLGKVYRLDIDEDVSVFGIARTSSEPKYRYMSDEFIMQTVDFKEHKGTAYLPYEIMVKGNQIIALHMRFRMALHYPDLSMMGKHSFMSIRPSPKEIAWGFSQISQAPKQ